MTENKASSVNGFPTRRPRRNRRTPELRELLQETRVEVHDLVQPLFVRDGGGPAEEIESLPGNRRLPLSDLVEACVKLRDTGIRAVILFPCTDPGLKDSGGSNALDPDNLIARAVRLIKEKVSGLAVMTDVALDPYTDHGHDGVLDTTGDVDNDRTVEILAKMSVLHAQAGADIVAPSDMMDGRVGVIREALDADGFVKTGIMAYSAKYASAFYGPFREAVGSDRPAEGAYLDKKTYQLHPANRREAFLEAVLDAEEGADILMVKPAGPYLDIISGVRKRTNLPLAAYQVSGEYAQLHAAAKMGWLDLKAARDESLLGIKRAGADIILTYFAGEIAKERSIS